MAEVILLNENKIRSYEVSIWTLQDSFITVLKHAHLENKGQIQDPKLVLDVDGTQEFSFSIPMYLMPEIDEYNAPLKTTRTILDKVENPIWYNTLNGNLMVSMRKIKVILNKNNIYESSHWNNDEEEKVYEFMLTKVTERHENGELYCDVECEGLAFHELGKQGYKISLDSDTFLNDLKEWEEAEVGAGKTYATQAEKDAAKPICNIEYWNDKFLSKVNEDTSGMGMLSTKWYYEIRVKYPYSQNAINKIYDIDYVSSWDNNGRPEAIKKAQEKCRIITISESNYYNITQNIAETFGVYCRYEYLHDANYRICGRRIIYYNNFIEEESGHIDITYPYQSSSITKEMDSTDLVTKLFVRPMDYEYSPTGQITIMDVDANKSREDYILNFDYLYDIGTISKEQYDGIKTFENSMHKINLELENLADKKRSYEDIKGDYEPKLAVAEKAITEAAEQINTAKDQISNLTEGTGNIKITVNNAKLLVIRNDKTKKYYAELPYGECGAIGSTIKLYDKNPSPTYYEEKDGTKKYTGKQLRFKIEYDKFGQISMLHHISYKAGATEKMSDLLSVYATYTYNPSTYWNAVQSYWEKVSSKNTKLKDQYDALLNTKYKTDNDGGLNGIIEALQSQLETKIEEKNNLIAAFYRMMGPALREGYWQPDDYQDYTDLVEWISKNNFIIPCTGNVTTYDNEATKFLTFILDSNKLPSEQDITFDYGIAQDTKHYMLIDLSQNQWSAIASYLNQNNKQLSELSFVYYEPQMISDVIEILANSSTTPEEKQEAKSNLENSFRDYHLQADCRLAYATYTKSGTVNHRLVLVVEPSQNFLTIKSNGTYNLSNFITECAKIVNTCDFSSGYDLSSLTSATDRNYIKQFYPRIAYVSYADNGANSQAEIVQFNNETAKACFKYNSTANSDNQLNIYSAEYLRIKIKSLKLKIGDDYLQLYYGEDKLTNYTDYSVITNDDEYYINIKPEVFVKYFGNNKKFKLHYTVSTADVAIYIDALQVAKENAYPKVSYIVDLNIFDKEIIRTIYNKLAKIVHINDFELKFKNVQGYISHIEMNLDNPSEDSIEVKNYKTKFEDLFSSIVAQTEEMKKTNFNMSAYANALNSDGSLTADAFNATLINNQSILNAYIDSGFDSSQVVIDTLSNIFADAGAILKDANSSLNYVQGLTGKNASILASFVSNVREGLTPTIYEQESRPANFKPGDIWINGDYIGVATSYNDLSGTDGGFTRTYDGTLAQIKGAGMDYDAQKGTVDIYGEHLVNLKSGKSVYIAAGDNVDIIGNKEVNIGGGSINIAGSTNPIQDDSEYPTGYTSGSINLISAQLDFSNTKTNPIASQITSAVAANSSISRVLISPTRIEMGASELKIASNSRITLIASENTTLTTAAMQLSTSGIFIGSGQKVVLYSGNLVLNNDGTINFAQSSGTNVELTNQHLILGYSQISGGGSVIELKNESIILGVGDIRDTTKTITGTSTGLIGARFTKDSIGFATTSNNGSINAILMNDKGVTIGSGSIDVTQDTGTGASGETGTLRASSGSYVRVAATGIDIGSLADLYINTDNFKLQTHSRDKGNNGTYTDGDTILAIGRGLQSIGYNTTMAQIKTLDESDNADVRLVLNSKGLYLKGTVYATTFVASSDNGQFIANSTKFGLYQTNGTTGILTIDNNGNISAAGDLAITSGKSIIINSNSKIAMYSSGAANGFTISPSGINLSGQAFKIDIVKTDSNNNQIRKFLINTDYLTSSSNSAILIYNNEDWDHATQGIRYKNGVLSLKLSAANLIVGDTSLDTWVASQVTITDTRIWAGVKNSAGNASILEITDNSITIGSSGNFTVNANNFLLDTTKTGSNVMFRLGTSEAPKLTYSSSGGLEVSGKITADSGQIGPWKIADTWLGNATTLTTCNVGIRYSSTSTNKVAFFAGAPGEGTNWNAAKNLNAANFRVTTEGKVYINQLMVLDTVENGKWVITGKNASNDDDHEGVSGSGNNMTGYTAIDFSNLNFKSAISLRIASSDNGLSITANLWGKFNTSASASLTIQSVTVPSLPGGLGEWGEVSTTGNLIYRLGTASDNIPVTVNIEDASAVYNAGWNDCLAACGIPNGGTVRVGGTQKQLYDPDFDTWPLALVSYTSNTVGTKP